MIGKQVKIGAFLSYVFIILNTLYGLFLTPYILGQLGDVEYGVYKTIASLAAAVGVVDVGIGETVMRYIAQYRTKKEDDKIPNFMALMFIQAAILGVVIIALAAVFYCMLTPMYSNTLNAAQLDKGHQLFVILSINLLFQVVENTIGGIITGFNRFDFSNTLKIIRLFIRIILTWVILRFIRDSMVLVLIDLGCTIVFLLVEILYIRLKLKVKIKFKQWEKELFVESGKYTIFAFCISLAVQVNSNLDNVFIGAIRGPNLVTIYSFGLLIFGMFQNLSTAISGVMLPTVTNVLNEKNGNENIQKLVIKVGRIQFMLLGALLVGFFCVGNSFIDVWLGIGYEDVYLITLILMLPSLFELCVNVCLSVLRAKNMMAFRTLIVVITMVVNAVLTLLLVKYWSYIGAAIGTAVGLIIGSLIIMNIYYYKKLEFRMFFIYKSILKGTWLCLVIAGVICYAVAHFINSSWLSLIVGIVVFCIVYGICLLLFGFNKEERSKIPLVKKIKMR